MVVDHRWFDGGVSCLAPALWRSDFNDYDRGRLSAELTASAEADSSVLRVVRMLGYTTARYGRVTPTDRRVLLPSGLCPFEVAARLSTARRPWHTPGTTESTTAR